MIEYIESFFALFFTDIFYIYYLKAVEKDRPLLAGAWAVIVYAIASLAIINYIDNHWLLIPACAGGFAGSYAGIIIRKKMKAD
jgi:uncharacterized membrane protein YfcA